MKIIKDKKLFGIISMFDVIIVVIGILAVVLVYNYLYSSNSVKVGNTYHTTTFQIKLDNLPVGTNAQIEKEDLIYDNETNVYVGKVIDFEVKEYKRMLEDFENGKYVEAVVPNRETIILTLETSVYDAKSDLITENNYYIKVGKELYLRGPSYAGGGYIIRVDRLEESNG